MRPDQTSSAEISATEAAARLGLTAQALGAWTKRPGAPVRIDGRRVWCQWPAFARWREEQLIAAAMPGDVETLRAEKLRVEIDVARLELARVQGEFVTIDDYGKALGAILDRLMARLRALPVRLAHLGDAVEDEADAEVEAIIAELHGMSDDVLTADDDAETEPPEVDDAAA